MGYTMKRKIIAISVFLVLISMSYIGIATDNLKNEAAEKECSICAKMQENGFRPWCSVLGVFYNLYSYLANYHEQQGNTYRSYYWHAYAEAIDYQMAVYRCPNEPDL